MTSSTGVIKLYEFVYEDSSGLDLVELTKRVGRVVEETQYLHADGDLGGRWSGYRIYLVDVDFLHPVLPGPARVHNYHFEVWGKYE